MPAAIRPPCSDRLRPSPRTPLARACLPFADAGPPHPPVPPPRNAERAERPAPRPDALGALSGLIASGRASPNSLPVGFSCRPADSVWVEKALVWSRLREEPPPPRGHGLPGPRGRGRVPAERPRPRRGAATGRATPRSPDRSHRRGERGTGQPAPPSDDNARAGRTPPADGIGRAAPRDTRTPRAPVAMGSNRSGGGQVSRLLPHRSRFLARPDRTGPSGEGSESLGPLP